MSEDTDEVVHCTGTVTEYELNSLRTRIANGMTTADDVVLLDKVIKNGVHNVTAGDHGVT